MNEELLIELLEPFQRENFIQQLVKLKANDFDETLLHIEKEIGFVESWESDKNWIYYGKNNLISPFCYSLQEKKNIPIKLAVLKYLGESFENYYIQWKTEGSKHYKTEEYSTANENLHMVQSYYLSTLKVLISEIRKTHIKEQAANLKEMGSSTDIEPLKWNGSIMEFAKVLYEVKMDPQKRGVLLEATYDEIMKHFIFWDRDKGEYKKVEGALMGNFVSRVKRGYGDSNENYEHIRDNS